MPDETKAKADAAREAAAPSASVLPTAKAAAEAAPAPAPMAPAAPALTPDSELVAFLKSQRNTGPAVGPTKGLDATIPGGKFKVDGVWKNADGEEIHEDGSLVNPGRMVKDAYGRLVRAR